jgi:hypothetical protein
MKPLSKAGVLVRSLKLQPSAKGKRLVFNNNDMRVIDGTFVESKELMAALPSWSCRTWTKPSSFDGATRMFAAARWSSTPSGRYGHAVA